MYKINELVGKKIAIVIKAKSDFDFFLQVNSNFRKKEMTSPYTNDFPLIATYRHGSDFGFMTMEEVIRKEYLILPCIDFLLDNEDLTQPKKLFKQALADTSQLLTTIALDKLKDYPEIKEMALMVISKEEFQNFTEYVKEKSASVWKEYVAPKELKHIYEIRNHPQDVEDFLLFLGAEYKYQENRQNDFFAVGHIAKKVQNCFVSFSAVTNGNLTVCNSNGRTNQQIIEFLTKKGYEVKL